MLNIFDVDNISEVKEYKLTEEDWQKIDKFAEKYTANWDWNYGKSPKFDLERSERLSVGTVEVKMNVNRGIIEDLKIYRDFFRLGEISDVESKLIGKTYEEKSIRDTFKEIDINKYFGKVSVDELVQLFY